MLYRYDQEFPEIWQAYMANPKALFEHALSLHQSGKLAEAAAIYRFLLEKYPDVPQLLTYCCIVAFQLGEIGESILLFDKSLAVAPAQPLALSNLQRIRPLP